MARYAVTVGAKIFITPRCPITAHHIDFGIGASDGKGQVMEQIEHTRIVVVNIPSPVVTLIMTDPRDRIGIILIAVTVNDVKPLIGVRVKEAQSICNLPRKMSSLCWDCKTQQ